MASWKKLHGWQIREWNAGPRSAYLERALAAGKWSNASNFMRLWTLAKFGGVYLDTDIEVLKPLDPLLDAPMFFGWESPHYLNNAVLGSVKGHPGLRELLTRLTNKYFGIEPSNLSGPALMTEWAGLRYRRTVQRSARFTVYPEEYFYPVWACFERNNITARSYTNHHWTHLW